MSPTYLQNIAAKMAAQHADLVAKYGENFDAPAEQFGLNVAEACVINEWIESLRPEILAKQGNTYSEISPDEPYYGATGGGFSYTFLPTSLGTIITVKEAITGKELNVTDALGWFFYG
jgi:hypothetical protein